MKLNYDYTLENYLIGDNNITAGEAISAAMLRPGYLYNPLFIYGSTGSGKTHLLQALAHDAIKNKPYLNIRYATSEEFAGDIIEAMQNRKYKDFVNSCMSLDILLIDDTHLLKDRKYMMRELLYIFKRLYNASKQIIVSGDRSLKRIFKFGGSMFEIGFIAEIHPPVYNDSLKFLRRKAERAGLALNDDIFEKIAGKDTLMDFRELEGALARIKFLYNGNARSINPRQIVQ